LTGLRGTKAVLRRRAARESGRRRSDRGRGAAGLSRLPRAAGVTTGAYRENFESNDFVSSATPASPRRARIRSPDSPGLPGSRGSRTAVQDNGGSAGPCSQWTSERLHSRDLGCRDEVGLVAAPL